MSLAEVARTVGGDLIDGAAPQTITDGPVEFDSRKAGPGGLFLALPGERVDGHDFAAAALRAGAVAAIVTRPIGVPAVLVADPLDALARLAAQVLRRLPEARVIGITGSAGKTTTKDLVAALVRPLGPTVAPPGSFNNEIGHPYTVLQANAATRFLVLENSARGVGHIAQLCRVAPPQIAAVLNVGSAHLGEFGSREVIAQAKGELVEALGPDGVAILNADDPLVSGMRSRSAAPVRTFGTAADADVRADEVGIDGTGRARFTVTADGVSAPVHLRLVGEHQVSNALAALAIALAAGRPLEAAAAALAEAGPASRWRMEVTARPDGVTVINDAYNANPESMRAALRALHSIAAGQGGHTWAVLGSMAELGDYTRAEHEALGRAVAESGVDHLVAVGAEAPVTDAGARAVPEWRGESVALPDLESAAAAVREGLRPGDVVLVKASRSEGLERLAEALLADVPAAEAGR